MLKEACKSAEGLFVTLGEKFKQQYNETTYELMGRLQIKTIEYKYQEYDSRLKEQFKNILNDETITVKIIKELTSLKDASEVSSDQALIWDLRVEVQWVQKAVLDNMRQKRLWCNTKR